MGLEQLLERYGLFAVFAGTSLEGETIAVLGGVIAHRGLVSYPGVLIAAFAGSFMGDQLLFWLGRRYRDHPRVARWTNLPAYAKAKRFVERHPRSSVVLVRFLYGMRIAGPLAIGTTAVPATRFVVLNAASAAVWALIFTGLGFSFGAGLERVFGRIQAFQHVLLALAGLAIIGGVVIHLLRRKPSPAQSK